MDFSVNWTGRSFNNFYQTDVLVVETGPDRQRREIGSLSCHFIIIIIIHGTHPLDSADVCDWQDEFLAATETVWWLFVSFDQWSETYNYSSIVRANNTTIILVYLGWCLIKLSAQPAISEISHHNQGS
jgi:hypothetical protein